MTRPASQLMQSHTKKGHSMTQTTQSFDNGKIKVIDCGYGVEVCGKTWSGYDQSFWLQGDDYNEFMDFVDNYSPTLWASFAAYLTAYDYDLLFEVIYN